MLREAGAADIPAMHRVRLAVKENRLVTTRITESDYLAFIEKHGKSWVIVHEGEVVAFAAGDSRDGNIWALFVDPKHEKRGFGRALHDVMVAWLWSQGLSKLWLTTQNNTRAASFYEAAGWRRVGQPVHDSIRFELVRREAAQVNAVDEPITIVDYDPEWPSLFGTERNRVRAALRDIATRIEHFGSTAVEGMAGKPIVDLLVGVKDLGIASKRIAALEGLGYENFGEIFVPGRVYLRRRGPPHFNIAMTMEGGPFWQTQMVVRDYLRAHPEEAADYSRSKRETYTAGARMFSTYSQGKASFLAGLLERAQKWAARG